MAVEEISSPYFLSNAFLQFPLWEHDFNSMTVKRQVCKRLEYVYALVNKLDNIDNVSHVFFRQFRKNIIKQYQFYCNIALIEYGYQRKYFDFLYDFMCESFCISNCIDYYFLFQGRRTKVMVIIYFLRHLVQHLRSVLKIRIVSSLEHEE